jgi:hypothetical protein
LQGPFKKELFKQAFLYHVVAKKDAMPDKIHAQLKLIESEIKELQRNTRWVNDIVILYYQGSRVYVGDVCYLETKLNRRYPNLPVERFALDCRKLPTLPGVQLLLLNATERGQNTAGDRPPVSDPLTGVISYANLKGEPSGTPEPRFLRLMEKAAKNAKEGRLSEMVSNLKQFLEPQDLLKQYNLTVLGPLPLVFHPQPK